MFKGIKKSSEIHKIRNGDKKFVTNYFVLYYSVQFEIKPEQIFDVNFLKSLLKDIIQY